jgi:hypothetical protein
MMHTDREPTRLRRRVLLFKSSALLPALSARIAVIGQCVCSFVGVKVNISSTGKHLPSVAETCREKEAEKLFEVNVRLSG